MTGVKSDAKDKANEAFGFLQPRPGQGTRLGSAYDWARAKAVADIPEPKDRSLWRVHDDLYDFSTFEHPGGQDWLDVTIGNDITELIESSHPNIEKVRALMVKYKVRACSPKTEPRNSGAFTFDKKGFYSTFRDRAWKVLKDVGTGPTTEMLLIHDSLLFSFLALITCVISPVMDGAWFAIAIVTGFLLQCLGTCSHNFYHKRPNWRMYTWDITPYSSYEWKISHVYSHHTFPNTTYDYEVSVFEPFLFYLPVKKSMARLMSTPIVLFLISLGGMHIQGLQRWGRVLKAEQKHRWEHFIPVILLTTLTIIRAASILILSDDPGKIDTTELMKKEFPVCFIRLNVVYMIASFFFHNISLGAGHHNPMIWHQGDKIVDKLDWGIFQIISVARFETVDKSLLLTSTSFGNHAMHHLLPTVDHSKLPLVYPVYVETCKEFGIDFKDEWFEQRASPVIMGWVAMVKQALRTSSSSQNFPFHVKKL